MQVTLNKTQKHFFVLLFIAVFAAGCLAQGTQVIRSASAVQIERPDQLIGGPAASGRIGDILLQNHKVRFIIQQTKFNGKMVVEQAISPYGGTLIDADFVRPRGEQGQDVMGEIGLFYNLGRTARYTQLKIIDDGSLTGVAIVEARGRGTTLTNLNVNTAIDSYAGGVGSALLGDFSPDKDLGLQIVTRYILRPDQSRIEIQTSFFNGSGNLVTVLPGDIIDSGGVVEPFFVADSGILDTRHGSRGFGEQPGDLGANGVEMMAFRGEQISYGYVPVLPDPQVGDGQTVCALLVGVGVCMPGAEITIGGLNSLVNNDYNNFPQFAQDAFSEFSGGFLPIPGDGTAGFRRFVVLGNNSLATLTDQLAKIYQQKWTTIEGSIKLNADPFPGVDVAVLRIVDGNLNPFTVARTGEDGSFSVKVPPGEYILLPNKKGYDVPKPPYYGGGSSTSQRLVVTKSDAGESISLSKPFVFKPTGRLKIFVQDDQGNPTAARIWIFGNDSSPDVVLSGGGTYDLFPLLATSSTDQIYPFRDLNTDPLPSAPNGQTMVITDWEGDKAEVNHVTYGAFTGLDGSVSIPIEPGRWTIVATHGLEYDFDLVQVDVAGGVDTVASLRVEKAIDSFRWLGGDLHVHAINSPDAPTANRDRILSFLADGVDFLVSSDHGYRTNYQPVIDSMEADWNHDGIIDRKANQILLAILGEEVTTWDYGHFNAFPLRADPDAPRHPQLLNSRGKGVNEDARTPSTNGGALLWWKDDPAGGSGSVSTATEIFSALRTQAPAGSEAQQAIQVNHPFTGNFQAYFDIIGLDFDFNGVYNPDPKKRADQTAITETLSSKKREADRIQRRLLPDSGTVYPYYGDDFDLIELLNGTNYDALWKGMSYWFGFLDLGKKAIATGNSDTHDLMKIASGLPRNFVYDKINLDLPSQVDDPADLAYQMKNGKTFLSSGFFVTVTGELVVLSGGPVTKTVYVDKSLEPGNIEYVARPSAGSANGLSRNQIDAGYAVRITLYVDVQAPRWAPPSRIDIYSDTPFVHQDDIRNLGTNYTYEKYMKDAAVTSYTVPASETSSLLEDASYQFALDKEALPATGYGSDPTRVTNGKRYRLRKAFTFSYAATDLTWDRWFAVRVIGTKAGFPVLFHKEDKVVPVALVNPIWIDFDGLGWQSPCLLQQNPLSCKRKP